MLGRGRLTAMRSRSRSAGFGGDDINFKNARAWRCWLRGLRRRREARAKIVDQRSGYRDWSRNRSILVRGVVRGRTNGRGLPIHVGDETIEVTVRSVVT